MPRGARLDAPGTLHHVIFRGIERGAIFQDDEDRTEFLRRLALLVKASNTGIYAFALMTNHVHLLVKSGSTGLPHLMRRLLSGYAQYYNRRHRRAGHLFQNRYRSIICEEDAYFQKLVAYIHLNPLRAGLASSFEALDVYPWCGHSAVMGYQDRKWMDSEYVLKFFGSTPTAARQAYQGFLLDESGIDREQELTGGGLLRSHGGWSNVLTMRRQGLREAGDERILGSGAFVATILDQADESLQSRVSASKRLDMVRQDIETTCSEAQITAAMLRSGTRKAPMPMLRKMLARKFVREYGLSLAETARQLGVTTNAVSAMLQS